MRIGIVVTVEKIFILIAIATIIVDTVATAGAAIPMIMVQLILLSEGHSLYPMIHVVSWYGTATWIHVWSPLRIHCYGVIWIHFAFGSLVHDL